MSDCAFVACRRSEGEDGARTAPSCVPPRLFRRAGRPLLQVGDVAADGAGHDGEDGREGRRGDRNREVHCIARDLAILLTHSDLFSAILLFNDVLIASPTKGEGASTTRTTTRSTRRRRTLRRTRRTLTSSATDTWSPTARGACPTSSSLGRRRAARERSSSSSSCTPRQNSNVKEKG